MKYFSVEAQKRTIWIKYNNFKDYGKDNIKIEYYEYWAPILYTTYINNYLSIILNSPICDLRFALKRRSVRAFTPIRSHNQVFFFEFFILFFVLLLTFFFFGYFLYYFLRQFPDEVLLRCWHFIDEFALILYSWNRNNFDEINNTLRQH